MSGPSKGPPTKVTAYPTTAIPRCSGGQISASTPPVLLTGALPNKPVKNLVMRMVWISFAVAVPNAKIPPMKYG